MCNTMYTIALTSTDKILSHGRSSLIKWNGTLGSTAFSEFLPSGKYRFLSWKIKLEKKKKSIESGRALCVARKNQFEIRTKITKPQMTDRLTYF